MTPTRETILADFTDDIARFEADSPRAQQVATGASQIYGCTAESIYRLRGTEGTERLSWQAVVGKAIHEYAATARTKVRDGVVCEQTFVFRDVPATVDYLDPAQGLLVDYKSKDSAAEIADLLADGARPSWVAQVQLGAAAAREVGYDIRWVAILVLPREGSLEDAAVLGPWEYDEAQAIEAARWGADVDSLAADADVDPRDHRGKPYFFCEAYCPFFGPCRGGDPEPVDLSELAAPALAYREAQDTRDEAIERMKSLRPVLLGHSGIAGEVQVTSSAGGSKTVDEVDTDALSDPWAFVNPDEPLPTRSVVKTSSPRLTVKRVKR